MVIVRMCLGAILGLGLFLGGMLIEGNHVASVLQLTAFLLVAGTNLGFVCMAYPFSTQVRSWRLALGAKSSGRPELLVARHYFATMGVGFFVCGIAGVIVGLIHAMENLDKPDELGPGVAVAFISLLYGMMLQLFVAAPLGDAIAARIAGDKAPVQSGVAARSPNEGGTTLSTMPPDTNVIALHAKIGELVMQIDNHDKRSA
jgi:flagellar motor component MotA